MTLVERFIEISNWPTSRKVALLTGIILPAHFLAWAAVHYGATQIQLINLVMFDQLLATWTGAVVLIFMVSLRLTFSGRDANWTAYLLAVPYVAFVVAMIYLFGTASTALIVFYPILILFWALYFDERLAWVSLFVGLLLMLLVGLLESWGVLPYAPILLERSIDAQRNDLWFALSMYVVFQMFIIAFVISILVVRARRLQDARLQEAHQQLSRSSQLIRRYVPAQVADAILTGRNEAVDTHARRKLTFFFSDLVGFTDIAEQLEPEDLSRVLNEYFTAMTDTAARYDGTVDELSGDAILIFFGAPHITSDKDHALRAVRMAVDMQAAVQTLNARWQAAGLDVVFKVRMGLNTGVATIGNFGSEGRTKYAALGRSVNLAARIQAQCEPGKVLLSHATWLLVNDQIACTPKGEMQLKGITKPVMIYEVSSAGSDQT